MARVLAYLCNYWGIDYKTEVPGHQDIQADKIDPGNLLEACGYSRNVKIWINKLLNILMALNQHRARNYQQKQAKSQHLRHKVWLSIKSNRIHAQHERTIH